jgi:hypothetical protein
MDTMSSQVFMLSIIFPIASKLNVQTWMNACDDSMKLAIIGEI